MRFAFPHPSDLPADRLAAARRYARAVAAERHPGLDPRGAVGALVLDVHAALGAAAWDAAERLARSASLVDVADSPDLADPAIVDAILSNYGVTRRAATRSTGVVSVLLDAPTAATIVAGATFEINGVVFRASRAVAARVGAETDPLIPLADGRWRFDVPVIADDAGVALVRTGDVAEPTVAPAAFDSAAAATDFTSGSGADTSAELIGRLAAGAAARVWGGAWHIAGLLADAGIVRAGGSTSVVGAGDVALLRDAAGPYPVSAGGSADVYVAAGPGTARTVVSKSAVDATGGCVVTFAAGEVDGLLSVLSVRNAEGESVAVTSLTRTAGPLNGQLPPPGVSSARTCGYGAFQVVAVTLDAAAADGPFAFDLETSPGVLAAQDLLGSGRHRPVSGDVHCRAPVPFRVSVEIDVRGELGSAGRAVAAAVAAAVETVGFEGSVYAADVSAAATAVLPIGCRVARVQLSGQADAPGGEPVWVSGADELVVPDRPELGVSAATCRPVCPAGSVFVTQL